MVVRLWAVLSAIAALSMGVADAAVPSRFVPTLEAGDAVPAIPLIAQDGRRFTLSDFRGQAVVVSFIYTRCGDPRMCPLVAAKFGRMQHDVGGLPARLVLLTLDPGYDTPFVLKRYGRAFEQDPRYWTLATGSQESLDELAGRLGIASAASVRGVIVHTEAVVVIGPSGRIAQTIFGNAWTPADLLDAARSTLPGNTDRFAGLRALLAAALERCGGGITLGTTAIAGLFGTLLAIVGCTFWLAFRTRPTPPRTTKS